MTPSTNTPTLSRLSDEAGFTLPELLVAITIMVLVMGSLGFTLVGSLRSVQGAQERVQRSNDTTIVGMVFPKDLHSASNVTLGGTRPCTTTGAPSTPSVVITTSNVGTTTLKGQPNVWYGVTSAGALMRYECGTGSAVTNSTQMVDCVTAACSGQTGTTSPVFTCEQQTGTAPYFQTLAPCTPFSSVARIRLDLTIAKTSGAGNKAIDADQSYVLYGEVPR